MSVSWSGYLEDPVLYLGVDIAIKRDTAAIVAVIKHPEEHLFAIWGHAIFKPPVNIHQQPVALLERLLKDYRVAQVRYDPYQFQSEAQRLSDSGYKRLMREVNQQTEMVEYANTLDTHIKNGTILFYPDPDLRSHFSWAAAQETERGWRIIKRKQSRQIDAVVATAMALSGATSDIGYMKHPSYNEESHTRSLVSLP